MSAFKNEHPKWPEHIRRAYRYTLHVNPRIAAYACWRVVGIHSCGILKGKTYICFLLLAHGIRMSTYAPNTSVLHYTLSARSSKMYEHVG